MSGQGLRSARVAARVREELATLLRDMADPRLLGVLISRVEMTDDLQTARIFVRHELGAAQGEQERRSMLKGLEAAGGRLRRDVGKAVQLRRAPELKFIYDTGQDSAYRVEELLHEIRMDDEGRHKG
ncbi:30S ribosome-binding factor RbfA [Polyangium mundeleinium]|uniref:Ribosome-binding factor A n=1 Tax=Polyangium mundeleinium TaxID=2995306 RepID=A0ABT5ESN1_9BACT|nr:30S ribosome-binding factor RbfA [Polyangium mundeleinium]MDC0743741.1 30S ribosome-binding factor RbfA [Polyangium mundeleinium]